MKKIIFVFLALIFIFPFCFSQDIITMKSSEDIQAKVLELTTTEIKYKKFDNPNGPIYTLQKLDVLMIRYENGTKDIFSEEKKTEIISNPVKIFSERTFYIEKTSEGYEQAITDKLLKLDKIITTKQETSDYTIKCIISKNGGYGVPAQGSIVILDSKSGNSLLTSNSAKGMVNMFRGFQNPRFIIMKKIANDYLSKLLVKLKDLK